MKLLGSWDIDVLNVLVTLVAMTARLDSVTRNFSAFQMTIVGVGKNRPARIVQCLVVGELAALWHRGVLAGGGALLFLGAWEMIVGGIAQKNFCFVHNVLNVKIAFVGFWRTLIAARVAGNVGHGEIDCIYLLFVRKKVHVCSTMQVELYYNHSPF